MDNTEIPMLFDGEFRNIAIIKNPKFAGGYELVCKPTGSYSIIYFLSNLSHIPANSQLLSYLNKQYPELCI